MEFHQINPPFALKRPNYSDWKGEIKLNFDDWLHFWQFCFKGNMRFCSEQNLFHQTQLNFIFFCPKMTKPAIEQAKIHLCPRCHWQCCHKSALGLTNLSHRNLLGMWSSGTGEWSQSCRWNEQQSLVRKQLSCRYQQSHWQEQWYLSNNLLKNFHIRPYSQLAVWIELVCFYYWDLVRNMEGLHSKHNSKLGEKHIGYLRDLLGCRMDHTRNWRPCRRHSFVPDCTSLHDHFWAQLMEGIPLKYVKFRLINLINSNSINFIVINIDKWKSPLFFKLKCKIFWKMNA